MQGICTEMDGSFSIAFTMSPVCKTKRLVAETEFDQPSCAEENQQAGWWLLALLLASGPGKTKVNESKVGRTWMPLLQICGVQVAWHRGDERKQRAECHKVGNCYLLSILQLVATTTGASCEDTWKKVSEIWPGESREKTEQQVTEAEEVRVCSKSKEPLSSGGSVGGEGWVEEKHLLVSRGEADACKKMEWGAAGERGKHCV